MIKWIKKLFKPKQSRELDNKYSMRLESVLESPDYKELYYKLRTIGLSDREIVDLLSEIGTGKIIRDAALIDFIVDRAKTRERASSSSPIGPG